MNTIPEIVQKLVERFELKAHPEGGFYKELYRSKQIIPASVLDSSFEGNRNYCTSIYFLLTDDNFSAFHRIKQDEIWHFYAGSPLYVHVIDKSGNYVRHELSMNLENGAEPQLTVPAGNWFASSVKEESGYSLVGCTVAPGFDFRDFELADRAALIREFPDHQTIIESLTRV